MPTHAFQEALRDWEELAKGSHAAWWKAAAGEGASQDAARLNRLVREAERVVRQPDPPRMRALLAMVADARAALAVYLVAVASIDQDLPGGRVLLSDLCEALLLPPDLALALRRMGPPALSMVA